jgi:hypothetical protein
MASLFRELPYCGGSGALKQFVSARDTNLRYLWYFVHDSLSNIFDEQSVVD